MVALQAVTAGHEVTELMAELERDGEFAEQLFVHGLGELPVALELGHQLRHLVASRHGLQRHQVTELMAELERDGELAEQLFVHGLGVQTAEGMAEWVHARARADLGINSVQGRRYSWGYPACPSSPSTRRCSACSMRPRLACSLSGGFAVEPEQSTLAIVAHHPQAVYFGMKSGFLPKNERQAADELIAGTDKDPTRLAEVNDSDPETELTVSG